MKRTPQYMNKSVKRLCLFFPIIVSEEILITDLSLILHIYINIFTCMSYLERALINVYIKMHSFYVNQLKLTKLRSVVK